MHNILIVDDEPMIRHTLKSLFEWESAGYSMKYEASNGLQALQILEENPDIDAVLTDINMPVMDGLELIRNMKERNGSLPVIVLSAYQDYNLVREAFKLGAQDYMLKTALEPEGVLDILEGLFKPSDTDERIDELRTSDKDEILLGLIKDQTGNDWKAIMEKFRLNIGKKHNALVFISIDNYRELEPRIHGYSTDAFSNSVLLTIRQVLSGIGRGEVVCLTPGSYVLFLSFDELIGYAAVRSELSRVVQQVQHFIGEYMGLSTSIGISRIRDGYGAWPQLFQEAAINTQLRLFYGKGKIIFPEDAEPFYKKGDKQLQWKPGDLVQHLKHSERQEVEGYLAALFRNIRDSASIDTGKTYTQYTQVLFDLIYALQDSGAEISGLLGEDMNFIDKMQSLGTVDEIEAWIEDLAGKVYVLVREDRDVILNRYVDKAKAYIQAHYSEDLTLKTVSDFVGLSESHLSRLFSKHIKLSFTDYLTHCRIEKAKELMATTDLKVYEISLQLGYLSSEHFSRIFKKVTGLSPNQYKQALLQG